MMNYNLKIEYILIGLVIALTGFEILFRADLFHHLLLLFVISVYSIYRRIRFDYRYLILILLFSAPILIQGILFDNIRLGFANAVSLSVKFLIVFLILELTKKNFHETFVGFVYFLAIISLIFFPTQFLPSFQEDIKETLGSIVQPINTAALPEGFKSKSLIFFTYQHSYGHGTEALELRNCGAFWEPGMFAVFLNLAILFNIFINNERIFGKRNLIFIITIITTFSTTGIITLAIILLSTFLLHRKKTVILLYFPIMLLFIGLFYNYIWKLEFMGGKIKNNIAISEDDRRSRFGAFLYHFSFVEEDPWSGAVVKVGQEEAGSDFLDKQVSPNGISLIFLNWGIPMGLMYYILFSLGIRQWLFFYNIRSRKFHWLFCFIFLMLAFSQDITLRFFYLMIIGFFIAFSPSNTKKTNSTLKISV